MTFCGEIVACARGSLLARAQCQEVLEELKQFHPCVYFTLKYVETTGDRDQKTSLTTLDKTDFFTREIDEMQLKRECRISIHSAKDLPDPLPEGLALAALTRGVDPSDVLVLRTGETLQSLAYGARVGTSSLRREKTVKALRPDLQFSDIRGTVDRRLQQLDAGDYDALIMAEAALIRLQLTMRNRIRLECETAPLQGKLAILARIDDFEMLRLFAPLDTR